MWHEIRLFLIALHSLTRVPVPLWVGSRAEWLQASARHLPGVGLLLGGIAGIVLWGAAHLWPALVSVLLSMAVLLWLTRGLHETGLAAAADGFAQPGLPQQALARMQTSALGSHGALSLLLVLGLKAAALHALATRDLGAALAVLPLAHAWSRAGLVLLQRGLPELSEPVVDAAHAMAAPAPASTDVVAAGAGGLPAVLAWVVLAAIGAMLFLRADALIGAALACGLVTMLMARGCAQRLGGRCEATLGATQQLCELTVYLAVLAVLAHG